MKDGLIKTIGRQLNIPYSSDAERVCQIIYSVAGKMALASLWDHSEGDNDVSIQHFKRRIQKVLDAYSAVYPAARFLLPEDKNGLIDDIYDIYLRTGYFYHSSHRISPAAPAKAGYQNCILLRGAVPDAPLCMSGLGYYAVRKEQTECPVSVMFDLQKQSFEDYLSELLGNSDWESASFPEDTEYLRLDPPFQRGYWQQRPVRDGRITLVRYGSPNKLYAFGRYDNGVVQQKAIPYWRLRNDHAQDPDNYEEYRRISTALLMRYGTLPAVTAKRKADLVEVSVGYRLPPTEEAFFRLYSWPSSYDISPQSQKLFTRKMSKEVFPVFKNHLESLGYRIAEG